MKIYQLGRGKSDRIENTPEISTLAVSHFLSFSFNLLQFKHATGSRHSFLFPFSLRLDLSPHKHTYDAHTQTYTHAHIPYQGYIWGQKAMYESYTNWTHFCRSGRLNCLHQERQKCSCDMYMCPRPVSRFLFIP